jgi:hypothetical protein
MNDEVGRLWKKVIMVYFKVLFQHLPGMTKENDKKPQRG